MTAKDPGEGRDAELRARLRANTSRRAWPETKGRLAAVLGIPLTADGQLEAARADTLVACADERVRMSDVLQFAKRPAEAEYVWRTTNLIASRCDQARAVLLVPTSRVHVGVEVDARIALRRARELVEAFRVFRLVSDDCHDGVVVDYYNVGYADDTEYSLTAWGVFKAAARGSTAS